MVLGVEYEAGTSGSGLCFWDGCALAMILCVLTHTQNHGVVLHAVLNP